MTDQRGAASASSGSATGDRTSSATSTSCQRRTSRTPATWTRTRSRGSRGAIRPVSRTTDYAELLEDPTVDAIAIATTVGTHHALAKRALAAGKHVFVEKPLAGSTEEAVELAELAAELGLVLMPGHTFLYSPPVNKIRELIQAGELGDIYSISTSRVNLGLHQPDVSVVWDLGPHDFSILRYWLDESPTQVMAMSRGCILPDIPDVAFVTLEFPSGTIANVELSWLAPSKLRRTTIIGSRKMVVYDDTSSEPVRDLRLRRHAPRPDDVRRVQAHLPDGRHRLSTDRGR